MSQMDLEKLRADLMGQATQAQERTAFAFATRGAPEEASYAPKALRIKDRVFGEAELADADNAINRMIGELKGEASFRDEVEAAKFEQMMRKKMRQAKVVLMRQAGQFDKKMKEKNLDHEKRAKMLTALSSLASFTGEQVVTSLGKRNTPTPIADSMQSPGLGSQFSRSSPGLGGNYDFS